LLSVQARNGGVKQWKYFAMEENNSQYDPQKVEPGVHSSTGSDEWHDTQKQQLLGVQPQLIHLASEFEIGQPGPADVEAARPILSRIVYISGGLAGLAIIGGLVGIIWNVFSRTEIDIFGAKITTGHVGVAFVALGFISLIWVYRAVLTNIYGLAALPGDKPRHERKKTGRKK
jgi:hypothetical protein